MSGADVASVRTIAVQLRSLSSDYENQPIIAREEGCMRALVGFIAREDIQVASIAIAALKNLAGHPDNFTVLRSEEGLMDALKDLLVADESDRSLRQDVFDIIEELTDENNDQEMDELDELEANAGLKVQPQRWANDDDPALFKDPVTARLHVPGISDEVFCLRLEQIIVRKRGVISVVFEVGAEVAVVFTRLPPEQLCSFVSTMSGTAVKLLPEEKEEEEEVNDEIVGKTGNKENNQGQPGYLDETGQRLRDVARTNAKKKHTITQGASSLHERLKAQREEESRKKARASRLMDSIGRGMRTGWGIW